MKIKQIIIGVIASTLIIGSIGPLDVQAASAGQDDFIMPYYNGYVESVQQSFLKLRLLIWVHITVLVVSGLILVL